MYEGLDRAGVNRSLVALPGGEASFIGGFSSILDTTLGLSSRRKSLHDDPEPLATTVAKTFGELDEEVTVDISTPFESTRLPNITNQNINDIISTVFPSHTSWIWWPRRVVGGSVKSIGFRRFVRFVFRFIGL